MRMHGWRRSSAATLLSIVTVLTTMPLVGDVAAEEPRWIVTMGDSAISGEAGRWAGNTNGSSWRHDVGADTYLDSADGSAESLPGCHRSKSAAAHIGGAVRSLNLACSGARVTTRAGGDLTPGFDWYEGPDGASQVVQLREFVAAGNDVDAVVVLIGANDFGFGDIVRRCLGSWFTSTVWWRNHCSDDEAVAGEFTASAVEERTRDVTAAIDNVVAAMDAAGDWTLIVQTYWSPVPRGDGIRYPERGWTRQTTGGCGIWNRDADWANDVAIPAMNRALTDGVARSTAKDYVILDMSDALDGHRLCERGVGLLEEVGLDRWTGVGAADLTEWVSPIRTVTTVFGPYQVQEGLHANHWGQLAMRNCLRQAYDHGDVRGGRCTSTGGVNARGEPNMALDG